jgi:nifR3 family TIM-barrel protein
MAGITDRPFRDLVLRFGAGLVVSEMVASQDMVTAKPSVRARAELGFGHDRTAVQLAGRDPHWMAKAARMAQAQGARIIDINMGCPAKKVTTGLSGAALMRDPELALDLIKAVIGAVTVPVTLKMRLGWDEGALNAPDLARQAQDAGVQMITIHGRTRCQFYKGQANWVAIRHVVNAVSVPVIANGDIVDATTARAALNASGAAGVMVGRGSQGRPWVLAQIAAELAGKTPPTAPHGAGLVDLVAGHYDAILSFYGRDLGLRVARKHLGWYMDDATTGPDLRRLILRADDPAQVLHHLPEALLCTNARDAA